MTKITQDAFLKDVSNQLNQYTYRSLEMPINDLVAFLQLISGKGNLNWHVQADKDKLASVFSSLSSSISAYTLNNGDFRTFVLMSIVKIVSETYSQELFNLYLSKGYNVDPVSVVGDVASNYSTQPPQNTNFPGIDNTSNEFLPEPSGIRLVPSSLYATDLDK